MATLMVMESELLASEENSQKSSLQNAKILNYRMYY